MRQLASAFVEIAFRRRGPENLPDSGFLLLLVLAANVAIHLFANVLHGEFSATSLLLLASSFVFYLIFIYAVLVFFKLDHRYRQTATAIFGADIVTMILYFPFVLAAVVVGLDTSEGPFVVVRIVRELWYLFIGAFLLAQALGKPLFVGILIQILYVLTSLRISYYLIVNTTSADSVIG